MGRKGDRGSVGKSKLTKEEVLERLQYHPETGSFTRRAHIGVTPGQKVGTPDTHGFLETTVAGKRARVHQLVWLMETGEWPKFHITHKNGDPKDNRFKNLIRKEVARGACKTCEKPVPKHWRLCYRCYDKSLAEQQTRTCRACGVVLKSGCGKKSGMCQRCHRVDSMPHELNGIKMTHAEVAELTGLPKHVVVQRYLAGVDVFNGAPSRKHRDRSTDVKLPAGWRLVESWRGRKTAEGSCEDCGSVFQMPPSVLASQRPRCERCRDSQRKAS